MELVETRDLLSTCEVQDVPTQCVSGTPGRPNLECV